MSICEVCGVDVPTMNQVVKLRFGSEHFYCSEAHALEAIQPAVPAKAPEVTAEEAPRPEPPKRGRPVGSKNKPKA